MPNQSSAGGITDGLTVHVNGEDQTPITKGPDPAVWGEQPDTFEPDPPSGETKGPDPDVWGS